PNTSNTPAELRYSAWRMSNDIRGVFDGVIADNYAPQILKAYDENDRLVHPNDVSSSLSGALVSATCTLEKMLFSPKGAKEW
ncbi:hypothetical protein FRC08_006681, partial [Ceratobasidium sp. 394]